MPKTAEEIEEEIVGMGCAYAERYHLCPLFALRQYWDDPHITPSPRYMRDHFYSLPRQRQRELLRTIGEETNCNDDMIYHGL
jgi:hypothetical protein